MAEVGKKKKIKIKKWRFFLKKRKSIISNIPNWEQNILTSKITKNTSE